jgi:hypothetical protein
VIVRGLTARTRKRLGAQAQDAAERLIAAEAMALDGLWRPAESATARLVARLVGVEGADADRLALGAVLEESRRLEDELKGAVVLARFRARTLSERAVDGELSVIRSWSEREGAGAVVPEPRPEPEPERDLLAAALVAASVVAAFRSRATSALGKREPGQRAAEALGAAFPEAKLRLNASVLAAEAYQAGRAAAWQSVLAQTRDPYRAAAPAPAEPVPPLPGGGGAPPRAMPPDTREPETRLPYGWLAGTFRVWSAILDRRTCPVCSSADGTMVPVGAPWPEGRTVPLHTRCRCVELTVFVPEAHAAKLPGMQLDYDALKADVRDYFRGSSLNVAEGRRHVGGFIRDTMDEGSPKALTRRLYGDRSDYAAPPPRPNRSLSVEGRQIRRQIVVPAPGTAYPNLPTGIDRPPGAR